MTEKELNRLAALLELRVVRALVAEMGDAFERMLGRAEDKAKATSPPPPSPAFDLVSSLPCPYCSHPHVPTKLWGYGVVVTTRGVRDKRQAHCDRDRESAND